MDYLKCRFPESLSYWDMQMTCIEITCSTCSSLFTTHQLHHQPHPPSTPPAINPTRAPHIHVHFKPLENSRIVRPTPLNTSVFIKHPRPTLITTAQHTLSNTQHNHLPPSQLSNTHHNHLHRTVVAMTTGVQRPLALFRSTEVAPVSDPKIKQPPT